MISWALFWLVSIIQAGRNTVRRAIVLPFLAAFAKIEAETDADVDTVLNDLASKSPKAADLLRAAIAQLDSDVKLSVPIPESPPKPVKKIGRPRNDSPAETQPGQRIPKP